MNAQELLQEISDYCRQTGLAESTFGRRAVNDGKLTSRLRNGGRITTETLDRIRTFMTIHDGKERARPMIIERGGRPATIAPDQPGPAPMPMPAAADDGNREFRFFDNRQKYLLFVNTCSEKWVVANKVAQELGNIHPRPPAVRLFDAGLGDGTVLTRVMRAMHHRYPNMPFYISGKEISLEDIRLTLEKMPDRLYEHPSTVLVLTNMYYVEAPWLTVKSTAAANSLVWNEVALTGNTSHDFEEQITDLQGFLDENWKAGVSAKTGNPIYERPVVLVIYRQDHKFLLDPIIPQARRGACRFRSDHRLAALSRARLGRVQGAEGDRPARPRARTGRTADRDPFLRQRSRLRNRAAGLAGRQSVPDRPPRHPARSEEGARTGRARSQLQHLCR